MLFSTGTWQILNPSFSARYTRPARIQSSAFSCYSTVIARKS